MKWQGEGAPDQAGGFTCCSLRSWRSCCCWAASKMCSRFLQARYIVCELMFRKNGSADTLQGQQRYLMLVFTDTMLLADERLGDRLERMPPPWLNSAMSCRRRSSWPCSAVDTRRRLCSLCRETPSQLLYILLFMPFRSYRQPAAALLLLGVAWREQQREKKALLHAEGICLVAQLGKSPQVVCILCQAGTIQQGSLFQLLQDTPLPPPSLCSVEHRSSRKSHHRSVEKDWAQHCAQPVPLPIPQKRALHLQDNTKWCANNSITAHYM